LEERNHETQKRVEQQARPAKGELDSEHDPALELNPRFVNSLEIEPGNDETAFEWNDWKV
jgi:hypothetical protein